MRFIKRTNANSISELVEKNTGMKADEFLNVMKNLTFMD